MKRSTFLMLAPLIWTAAHADMSMLDTAARQGCFVCHSVQAKTGPAVPLAPAFADIAERFRSQENAADYLAQRIVNGTVDTQQDWENKVNMRFMPPNVNVSQEEARRLANWVLSIRRDEVPEAVVRREGMLTLAVQNGCIACHGVSKEDDSRYIPLAPPFHAIADRYRNVDDAKETLLDSIVHGTVDKEKKWPDTNMRFMPPNPTLGRQDAETLVDWILSLQDS